MFLFLLVILSFLRVFVYFARCLDGKHAARWASPVTLTPDGRDAAAMGSSGELQWNGHPTSPLHHPPHSNDSRLPRNHQIMILRVYYKKARTHIHSVLEISKQTHACEYCCSLVILLVRLNYLVYFNIIGRNINMDRLSHILSYIMYRLTAYPSGVVLKYR